jgi:hypothetical protein
MHQLTVASVPVHDMGLQLLRDHAMHDLGKVNPEIRNAQSLPELLAAVLGCVPLLVEVPSTESVAIIRTKHAIQSEMHRRGHVNG